MAYTPNISRIEDDGTVTSMALVERRELEKLRTLLAAREKECDELQAVIREICETAPIDAAWGLRNAPTWHRWRRAAGLERPQTECEKLVENLNHESRTKAALRGVLPYLRHAAACGYSGNGQCTCGAKDADTEAREVLSANSHALAEERSDDSQQRVVGGKVKA